MLHRSLRPFGLALALLSIVWFGCAHDRDNPTGPSGAPPNGTAAGAFEPTTSKLVRSGLVDLRYTAQQITNEGGTVVAGRVKVTIPQGALLGDTVISVQAIQEGGLTAVLGPHGTVFETPVTLEFDLRGYPIPAGEEWTIYWWDDANGKWVDLNADWSPETKKVFVLLEHFSTYQPGPRGRAGW